MALIVSLFHGYERASAARLALFSTLLLGAEKQKFSTAIRLAFGYRRNAASTSVPVSVIGLLGFEDLN